MTINFIIKRFQQAYFALLDHYTEFDEMAAFQERNPYKPIPADYTQNGSLIAYRVCKTKAFYPKRLSRITRLFNAIIYGDQYK